MDREQNRGADVQYRQDDGLHEAPDEPCFAALREEEAVQHRLKKSTMKMAMIVPRKNRSRGLTILGKRSRRCLLRNERYSESLPFASCSNVAK